jgi:hypothetical protein
MSLTFANLVDIAKRTGVERWVDPRSGRRGQVIAAPSSHRGANGSMGTVVGCTRHHTGTPEEFKPTEDYPSYNVVKEGRPGLENTLSAYGLGRWYGIYVFSEFICWHCGEWLYAGITDGNGHFCGFEAEGTGRIWTPFQQEFYPRLSASFLDFINEDIDMMPRHADGAMPRGRKDDAKNLPANFTSRVAAMLANPSTIAYGGTVVPPTPLEEILATTNALVLFVSPKTGPDADKVFACSLLTFTRVHVPDQPALKGYKHWLDKEHVPFDDGPNGTFLEVDDIDAFGIEIKPSPQAVTA